MSNDSSKRVIKSNVSVVIPTLGGDSLYKTIEKLNHGSLIPHEILICIPKEFSSRVENYPFKNIRIILSNFKGQVGQRAEGFQKASGKYILQLDDDIIVDYQCLEILVSLKESMTGKWAISPALRYIESDRTVYPQPTKNLLRKLYYFILNGFNGYKSGSITKAGTEIGVDTDLIEDDHIEVEWLPGGCVLHSRENLILYDFYPLHGKAFCEDLYHSALLTNAGVKFLIACKAIVWIEDPRKNQVLPIFSLKNILADYAARKKYLKTNSKNIFRMKIYYFLTVLKEIGRSLRGKRSSNKF